MTYSFTIGDLVVIRQEATNNQRLGKVVKVNGRGQATIQLYKDRVFKREGTLRINTDGASGLGLFTLIKHVPHAELLATGRMQNV
jgi:hypothetical protein